MKTKILTAALLSAAVIGGSAYAQTSPSTAPAAPAATADKAKADLSARFKKVTDSCKECHVKYRD